MVELCGDEFKYLLVSNSFAKASIALSGAQLFSYIKEGESELLWLASGAIYEEGTPIRGGIPICWPWFGHHKSDASLPQHGFASLLRWKLSSIKEERDSTSVTLKLEDSDLSREFWSSSFLLEATFNIGSKLEVKLKTTNQSEEEMQISQALHTYFRISDLADLRIKGLNGKRYLDALDWKREIQNGDVVVDGEIDRVYQGVSEVTLQDRSRVTSIKNSGSSSCVVWNPYGKLHSQMREGDHRSMICLESSNAFDDARVVPPNSSHTLSLLIF